MPMFRRGQKVVCIKAPERSEYQCKVGKIYTVDNTGRSIPLLGVRGYFRNELFREVKRIYLGGE